MFGTGFNSSKLKPQLKMAVSRFQIASNKKSALMKQNMREVAKLLAEDPPKEEKARIRAEALIRDDNMIEAYDILQLECELLAERIKLIESTKQCPPDLVSCISDLIYASPRVDIPELQLVRKQFRAKYGKKFEENAMNNPRVLNERIVSKLSVHPPAAYLVQTYLEKICEQYEVDWKPTIRLTTEQMIEPMAAPIGFSIEDARGTGLGAGLPVSTGQEQGVEINYQKLPHAPGLVDVASTQVSALSVSPTVPSAPPPMAPSAAPVPPMAPSSAASMPTVRATPEHPKLPPPTVTTQKNDDIDEPDIFVVPEIPMAPPGSAVTGMTSSSSSSTAQHYQQPSAPPGSAGGETKTSTINQKKHDDDDDDVDNNNNGIPPSAPGGGGSSDGLGSSYANLAARFEALSK